VVAVAETGVYQCWDSIEARVPLFLGLCLEGLGLRLMHEPNLRLKPTGDIMSLDLSRNVDASSSLSEQVARLST
jgi:hypothetical protein